MGIMFNLNQSVMLKHIGTNSACFDIQKQRKHIREPTTMLWLRHAVAQYTKKGKKKKKDLVIVGCKPRFRSSCGDQLLFLTEKKKCCNTECLLQ